MADNTYPGAMVMVKIDGSKVKKLREQNGLTQLYVATAVQVTTDTISRWENKRYPTIKKENGLRLAEALEVTLEDILETGDSPEFEPDEPDSAPPSEELSPGKSKVTHWPLFIAVIAVIGISGSFAWFFIQNQSDALFLTRRILPSRCTGGQPFPVVIEIISQETKSAAIILKEYPPGNASIISTHPPLPASGSKNNSLRWLHKTKGRTLFTYIATLDAQPGVNETFSGTISTGSNSDSPQVIEGNSHIIVGTSHWADSNGDNIINDPEILAVYDQYEDLEQMGIDIDLIEEIWLGSGYRWNPEDSIYEIIP